jgi:hypothetical protein
MLAILAGRYRAVGGRVMMQHSYLSLPYAEVVLLSAPVLSSLASHSPRLQLSSQKDFNFTDCARFETRRRRPADRGGESSGC